MSNKILLDGVKLRERDRRAMELIYDYWQDRNLITSTELKHKLPGVNYSKQVQRVRDRLNAANLIKTRKSLMTINRHYKLRLSMRRHISGRGCTDHVNITQMETVLETLDQRVDALSADDDPPKTMLRIIDEGQSEKAWHLLLAYFIDPSEPHGFGTDVLEEFLYCIRDQPMKTKSQITINHQ